MTTDNSFKSETGDAILEERKKRIFSKKSLLFFLISLALVAYLIYKLDLDKTVVTITQAAAGLLLLSVLIYGTSNFFKALRFHFLLKDFKIGFLNLLIITSYHNFFNQVLPARTGELTLVYYLKKIAAIDVSKGLHSLLVVRIFDFIIISVFFISSIIFYYGRNISPYMLILGGIVFIFSIAILFNLKWIVLFFTRTFTAVMKKLSLAEKPLIMKINGKIDSIMEEFSLFDTKKHIPMLALTSILAWCALYTLFYVSILALGVDINFLQSVAGATGGVLTNVLPINSFGSFGTLEAGWTGGFIMVGMDKNNAIITGFGYHLISFFASAFFALLGAIVNKIKS